MAVKTTVANLARLVYRILRHWLLMVFSTCTFPGASLGCETRSRRVLAGPPTINIETRLFPATDEHRPDREHTGRPHAAQKLNHLLITACRLIFNSLAAVSSSSSMPGARSTFTLCIGPIMRPALVKNRDTSWPSSARRAMASADIAFRRLRVFFIKTQLLVGRLPESH